MTAALAAPDFMIFTFPAESPGERAFDFTAEPATLAAGCAALRRNPEWHEFTRGQRPCIIIARGSAEGKPVAAPGLRAAPGNPEKIPA
jgi:hypothetical protein